MQVSRIIKEHYNKCLNKVLLNNKLDIDKFNFLLLKIVKSLKYQRKEIKIAEHFD